MLWMDPERELKEFVDFGGKNNVGVVAVELGEKYSNLTRHWERAN